MVHTRIRSRRYIHALGQSISDYANCNEVCGELMYFNPSQFLTELSIA